MANYHKYLSACSAKNCISVVVLLLCVYLQGSIGNALADLPQVGQLLGRLCTLPLLLACPLFYEALINCVLYFYAHKPASNVEEKAKTWAVVGSSLAKQNALVPPVQCYVRQLYDSRFFHL